MKQITTLILVFVLFSTLSMAQNQRPKRDPVQDAKKLTQLMKDSLSLTAEQLPKVEKLNAEYAQKQVDLMKDAKPEERSAIKEKMKPMIAEKSAKLKAILTADQLNKWESMQKNMHQRMGERSGGDGNKRPEGGGDGKRDNKPGGRGEGRGSVD